jgi:hypothetical protein
MAADTRTAISSTDGRYVHKRFGQKSRLGLLVTSALLLWIGIASSASAQVYFGTAQILDFEMIRGQPNWVQPTLDRIAGAVWAFFPQEQVFGHDQPDTRRDLFPVSGPYQVETDKISFEGHTFSTIGMTGSAYAYVVGEIQEVNGRLILTQFVATGMANGAVVNGQDFLNASDKLYRVSVALGQIQQ